MMKSFFKKLAFVMALAMVVTTAAPAANVFAAEFGIVAQDDKTWTIVETANVEVDEKADFKFVGAPSNWASLGFTWTSSDEDVATVNQAGVVTGVADGVAVITLADKANEYVATLEVTVGEGEVVVDNSYTYKQVTHKKATFTFNQDVEYTVADVTLVKVFAGGYEVNWPIETFKCEKNVVTIEPYVAFEDGDEYIIKIGAEDEGTTFTTTIGVVDYIEVAWKSLDQDVAYAKLSEDDEDIEVALSVKLFSNGVDVSGAVGYSLDDVDFEVVNTSDDFDLDENILVFEKPGVAATIKATYTYEVGGEEKSKDNIATIYSVPAPKYTIVGVDAWTIVDVTDEDVEINWGDASKMVHSIPAFDEAAGTAIVVLMTDSYGNKIMYPEIEGTAHINWSNTPVLNLSDITDDSEDTYIEAAEEFEIRFRTTNTGKIFVGEETGKITTLGTSSAPVLVSLYDENSEGEVVLVKNVFAAGIQVTGERKPSKIVANVWFDELLADVAGKVDPKFEKGTVEFVVTDQYGVAYPGVTVELKETNDKTPFTSDSCSTNNKGKAYYEFDGTDFIYPSKDKNVAPDSVKFTANVAYPYNSVSTTFTVKLESPEVDKNGVLEIEGYELAADDKDMKIKKEADGTYVSTDVTLYETSNGLRVGVAENVVLLTSDKAQGLLKDNTGAFSIKSGDATVGAKYVVIYGPDGKAIASTASTTGALGVYTNASGDYTVCLARATEETAAASGQAMAYMKTGDYTVKAYEVTKVYDDEDKNARLKDYSTTFTVSNTSATVSLKEQKYIDLAANDIDAETIEEVIFAAFNFKLGTGTLDEDYAQVVAAKTKYNEDSDYLYIYHVTFAVPLNNGTDDVWYHAYEVPVNKAVKVGDDFNNTLR